MAPSEHHLVTLKLAPSYLNNIDFSGTRVLTTKKQKKRTPPKRKGPENESNVPIQSPSKQQRISTPADPSNNTVHTDPILGNLPRSLKAAPAPNTAGLVIDKIPCRKWVRKPLVIRTFTGFECNFVGWCSEFTEAERNARDNANIDEQGVTTVATSASNSPGVTADSSVKQLDIKPEVKSKKITLKLGKPPPAKEDSDTNESSDDEEDDEDEEDEEEIAPSGTALSDAESDGYANNSELPSSDPSEPY